jgi:hypothetical protein
MIQILKIVAAVMDSLVWKCAELRGKAMLAAERLEDKRRFKDTQAGIDTLALRMAPAVRKRGNWH